MVALSVFIGVHPWLLVLDTHVIRSKAFGSALKLRFQEFFYSFGVGGPLGNFAVAEDDNVVYLAFGKIFPGFCDRFHFSRTFKQIQGIAPAAFRRQTDHVK